ncbi:hypothetical protein NEFER03_0807 [Nematocida sp. LUAm3]|nr:hypothetical protein NEFER03_0807 [Nematocida sp. LUAm3]KAI5174825.1 hypothetical protein NEFER02_0925 [Nematocida sp. LUAm2]KAI5177577.1 hypothetical protein NEFER01_0827 [Nematocida sp. LUAm1]
MPKTISTTLFLTLLFALYGCSVSTSDNSKQKTIEMPNTSSSHNPISRKYPSFSQEHASSSQDASIPKKQKLAPCFEQLQQTKCPTNPRTSHSLSSPTQSCLMEIHSIKNIEFFNVLPILILHNSIVCNSPIYFLPSIQDWFYLTSPIRDSSVFSNISLIWILLQSIYSLNPKLYSQDSAVFIFINNLPTHISLILEWSFEKDTSILIQTPAQRSQFFKDKFDYIKKYAFFLNTSTPFLMVYNFSTYNSTNTMPLKIYNIFKDFGPISLKYEHLFITISPLYKLYSMPNGTKKYEFRESSIDFTVYNSMLSASIIHRNLKTVGFISLYQSNKISFLNDLLLNLHKLSPQIRIILHYNPNPKIIQSNMLLNISLPATVDITLSLFLHLSSEKFKHIFAKVSYIVIRNMCINDTILHTFSQDLKLIGFTHEDIHTSLHIEKILNAPNVLLNSFFHKHLRALGFFSDTLKTLKNQVFVQENPFSNRLVLTYDFFIIKTRPTISCKSPHPSLVVETLIEPLDSFPRTFYILDPCEEIPDLTKTYDEFGNPYIQYLDSIAS